MAEKTNVGMAVVIADITFTCGFGLDGAAALHTHYNTQKLEMVQRRAAGTSATAGTIPAALPECSASWSGSLWPRVEPIHACA